MSEYTTYSIYVPDHSEISAAHKHMRARRKINDKLMERAEALVAMEHLAWVGDEWRCFSQGRSTLSYAVTLAHCDCPSFATADYHIGTEVYCKHKLALWMYKVILEMDLQERCKGDGNSRQLRRSIQRRIQVAHLPRDNKIVRLGDSGEAWFVVSEAIHQHDAYKLLDERAMYDYARYLGEINADYQNTPMVYDEDNIYAAAVAAGRAPEVAVAVAESPIVAALQKLYSQGAHA